MRALKNHRVYVFFLSMVSLSWCGGELYTAESALKSSTMWESEEPLLISLKGGEYCATVYLFRMGVLLFLFAGATAIPEFFLDFARSWLDEHGSTSRFVEVSIYIYI